MQLMNTFAMLSFASLAKDYLVVSGGLSRERVLDLVWTVNTVTGSTVKSRGMRDSYRTVYVECTWRSGYSNWYTVVARRQAYGRRRK